VCGCRIKACPLIAGGDRATRAAAQAADPLAAMIEKLPELVNGNAELLRHDGILGSAAILGAT
jgi:hypothetical protein